jgi:D-beta-D-heptose 7-phosphate kinase/D-beta-D-heptose 1-phosphate adenosyltransferase
MKKIVIATGGFDPLHSGHIQYLKRAKELGDILYVGVNSDEWLVRKKGKAFMSQFERLKIIQELKFVDYTIVFNDDDNSAKNAIHMIRQSHPNDHIIFANGGDRTKDNIPEMDVNDDLRYSKVEFVFGVGGNEKANSSSWILDEWKAPKTNRAWGYYKVLHENGPEVKLKELTVDPGICLSMQKHDERSEFWFISEGRATVYTLDNNEEPSLIGFYEKFEHLFIKKGQWHRLCNETENPLRVIEIQYGTNCIEEDIVRK